MERKCYKVTVRVYELTDNMRDLAQLQDFIKGTIRIKVGNYDKIEYHFPNGEIGKSGDYLVMYSGKSYEIHPGWKWDKLHKYDLVPYHE
jgi:hypothetical protein